MELLLTRTLIGFGISILSEYLKSKGYTIDSGGLTNDAVAAAGAILGAYGRVKATLRPIKSIAGVPYSYKPTDLPPSQSAAPEVKIGGVKQTFSPDPKKTEDKAP